MSGSGLAGGVLLSGLILLVAASTRAQPDATQARRAAARVLVVRDAEVLSSGSGAVIDPAGYVLTCFHVVGHIAGPLVGTLRDPRARLIVELSSRSSEATAEYEAELVRDDVRRDLALLRIVRRLDGATIPAFAALSIGTARPGPATLIGYPDGAAAAEVHALMVLDVVSDGRGTPSWLRLDEPVARGCSGGPLLDARGGLIGIPVRSTVRAGFARAIEQIPGAWLRELRSGVLGAPRLDGAPLLAAGSELAGSAVGLLSPERDQPEILMYRVDTRRGPVHVMTTPPLSLVLVAASGEVRAVGDGSVEVTDGAEVCVGVVVPGGAFRAVDFRIRASAASP